MRNKNTTTLSRHKYHPLANVTTMFKKYRRNRNEKRNLRRSACLNKKRKWDVKDQNPFDDNAQDEAFHFPPPPNQISHPPDTPPRSTRMPTEIKVTPGTPDSHYSALSGTTGFFQSDRVINSNSKSMFKSVLPEISSETEECSIDRSTFTWTAYQQQSHDSSEGKKRRSDDNDVVSKKLSFGSPSKSYKSSKSKNFLTKSKFFQDLVSHTFDSIDIDKSGSIDKKELYTGLIMIHLKLAAYAGPAACRPASKEYVDDMFDKLDLDQNGTLNKQEFTVLITILCSQILSRVIVQFSMTALFVPLISQYTVDVLKYAYKLICVTLVKIDEGEVVSEYLMKISIQFWEGVLLFTPPIIQRLVKSCYDNLSDGFMDGMSLTLLSCLLGCLLVPWLIYKTDEFYNNVASRKSIAAKN